MQLDRVHRPRRGLRHAGAAGHAVRLLLGARPAVTVAACGGACRSWSAAQRSSFTCMPDWGTDFGAIAFGNAFRMLAVGGLWQGLRRLQRRRGDDLAASASRAWVGSRSASFPASSASMLLRVGIVSAINALLCGTCGLGADERPQRGPAVTPSADAGLRELCDPDGGARVAIAPLAPFPMGAGVADPLWVGGLRAARLRPHRVCRAALLLA